MRSNDPNKNVAGTFRILDYIISTSELKSVAICNMTCSMIDNTKQLYDANLTFLHIITKRFVMYIRKLNHPMILDKLFLQSVSRLANTPCNFEHSSGITFARFAYNYIAMDILASIQNRGQEVLLPIDILDEFIAFQDKLTHARQSLSSIPSLALTSDKLIRLCE